MEALKSLSKEHPELLDYEEFKKIIHEELPKSDELYYGLRDFYEKWKKKYTPKDDMTYARLELMDYLFADIQGRTYYITKEKYMNDLIKNTLTYYFSKYSSRDRLDYLFKETRWALDYLNHPNPQIAPSEYFNGTSHVTWDYMYKHQPKINYSYGI